MHFNFYNFKYVTLFTPADRLMLPRALRAILDMYTLLGLTCLAWLVGPLLCIITNMLWDSRKGKENMAFWKIQSARLSLLHAYVATITHVSCASRASGVGHVHH